MIIAFIIVIIVSV